MNINKIFLAKKLERERMKKNKIFIPPQIGEVNWKHVLKLKKSVIPKIYIPVILVTIWAALLKVFYDYYKEREFIKAIFFPTSLLTYVGLVLSLLLVFRNNSAYDRFWEGRKSWGNILNHARNLSRHIWICIEIDENDRNKDEKLNLKKGVMRLIIALVISIRHSLRGEYGWDYDDLSELVKHVPRFNSLFTTAPTEVLKVLPSEIAYHIEGFLYTQKDIPTPMLNQSYASLNAIIENFTTCERILTSPIPVIYGIHIKHVLLIYLLTLPLQIIPTCHWASVFIVFLTSFTLFGIEAISSEIENPFGKDRNDLRLDDFCQQIHDEINGMMKYFPSSVGFVDWFECEEIEDAHIVDKSDSVTLDINDDSFSSNPAPVKNKGNAITSTVRAISKVTNKIHIKGKGKGKGKAGNEDLETLVGDNSSEKTCINASSSNSNINYGSMDCTNGSINPLINNANDSKFVENDAAKPADAKPADAKPDAAKPDAAKPADAKPADAKPTDAKPADAKPADAKPTDAKPADAKPADAKPADAKPTDAKPDAAKPDAAKPADAKPADAKPDAAKPADAKPADTKPDDAKPTDAKPDTKPDAAKPADAKPTPSAADPKGKSDAGSNK